MSRCQVCDRCTTANSLFDPDLGVNHTELKPFEVIDGVEMCARCAREVRASLEIEDEPGQLAPMVDTESWDELEEMVDDFKE